MKRRERSNCSKCSRNVKGKTVGSYKSVSSCQCKKAACHQQTLKTQHHCQTAHDNSTHTRNSDICQQKSQIYGTVDPRQQCSFDHTTPITNLRIRDCEFPNTQSQPIPLSARNPPQVGFNFNQFTPSQQTYQHFNTNHGGSLYSPVQGIQSYINGSQSPFRPAPTSSSPQFHSLSPSRTNLNAGLSLPNGGGFLGQSNGGHITPTKQIQNHYERVIQEFEIYSKQRLLNLREGLGRIVDGLKADEIISAMREDPLSQNFAYHRMREVVDNLLLAESEQIVSNLRQEVVMLREKVMIVEAKSTKKSKVEIEKTEKKALKMRERKEYYKDQWAQAQEQISQLVEKFKEVEADSHRQHNEFEVKIAQKDGELARCEKVLSEVRTMLSDKTLHQTRAENNLSNDITVLSDRIVNLEREKNDLIDKYAKYGDEFKQLLTQEQDQYKRKIQKQKDQVKELHAHLEQSENKARELETQMRSYVKEIDDQRHKIEDLVKQTQERGSLLKEVEEKKFISEKDLQQELKSQKQKYKAKIDQLQSKFEQAFTEKCHQLETEAREKMIASENEKRDIEARFIQLQETVERQQEEDQQRFVVQQKQTEKKIEKLQAKFESEIKEKLSEAEEQFKELEAKMRKDFKTEKKALGQQYEQSVQENQSELKALQEQYEQEYRELSLRLREEIDLLQKQSQELKIKVAEQTVLIDSQKAEIERQSKEIDQLHSVSRETQQNHKEEVHQLEEKLRFKMLENDDKVKQALDTAIKSHNLEQVAQSYAQEVDKRAKELELEKDTRLRVQTKLEKINEDNGKLVAVLQDLRQSLTDKEMQHNRTTLHFRETLAKIFQFVKLQISKHRTEMDFTKRQFLSEIEMNRRQLEHSVQAIASKAKEVSYTTKFKLEKLQYAYEQKFSQEFSQREAEWERAWEKREGIIGDKERTIKELEVEKGRLREHLTRLEVESAQVKTQMGIQKKDTHRLLEEMKLRISQNELKSNELVSSYKRQEDQLEQQYKQQIQDLKLQAHIKSQEELKKIETQMADYKDKSKTKVTELATHIQDMQTKHRQEMIQLKHVYEEKLKSLEVDNDTKQKTLYERQNELNVITVKYQQIEKETDNLERQNNELRELERNMSLQLKDTETLKEQLTFEKDSLMKQRDELDGEAQELQTSNRAMQAQLFAAEKKIEKQRKELKQSKRRLDQSRKKEETEIQILNDILTIGSGKRQVMSRKSSVASPEFRREASQSSRLNTQRTLQSRRQDGNYNTLLSEINNMIDVNQVRLRGSHAKLQTMLNSPSVGHVAPSNSGVGKTFYHKSALKNNGSAYGKSNRSSLKENNLTAMSISDLKQY